MLFQRNDTVLFIGDSITDYNRARPVGEGLNNAWGTSYAAMASSLLCAMYPELHLRMINMGISGNQIRDLDQALANGRPGPEARLGGGAHWHQRRMAAV